MKHAISSVRVPKALILDIEKVKKAVIEGGANDDFQDILTVSNAVIIRRALKLGLEQLKEECR
jgi:hypothetical protein